MLEIEVSRQSATTSIKENNLEEIKLYPNPANSEVNFLASDLQAIQILTIGGREVFKSNALNSGVNTINVSDLEAGIYLVNLTTVTGVTTKRLEIIK